MTTTEQLSEIRQKMSACLSAKPKRIADYKALAAKHRRILHASNPTIAAQWKACHDRGDVR